MKRTINPNNKYFKVYECFHCCVCAFRVSMGLTFTNLLIEYRPYTDYALRVMEVLFLTNIYIRMHLRYYNEVRSITSTVQSLHIEPKRD